METHIKKFNVEYMDSPVGISTRTPHYSWQFADPTYGLTQTAYRIRVYGFIDELFWDSGFVKSDNCFEILHAGTPLKADTRYRAILEVKAGKKTYTAKTEFSTGLIDEVFTDAKWICAGEGNLPMFRKTFTVKGRIAFATAYVAARGFYEFYLNGDRVGDRVLAPAMLNDNEYLYHCCCDTYDITDMLSSDNNTLGFIVGDGYKFGEYSRYGWNYASERKLWCAVSIIYEDLSCETIVTDESWRWQQSFIVSSSIYDGEEQNLRLKLKNWCDPYADERIWFPAVISNEDEGIVNLCTDPVVPLETNRCTCFKERENEVTFCDFRKNTAGWLRLKVTGEPGTRVIVTHSENINSDGSLNYFTNRDAKATEIYTLKGHEIEILEPHFTYHCFRYAEVRMDGVGQLITADKITIGTRFERTGEFFCDDTLLQRMYDNAVNSLRINMLNFPTDNGVRDERTPCMMDNQAYEEFASKTFDCRAYFLRWLKNVRHPCHGAAIPNWDGELITLVGTLYSHYGIDVSEEYYPYLVKIADECEKTYNGKSDKKGEYFGDWCAPQKGKITNSYKASFSHPDEVTLCLSYYQLGILSQLAKRYKKAEDKKRFDAMAQYCRSEFYRKYYDAENCTFSAGAQNVNVLALAFGLVKSEDRSKVYRSLKKNITQIDNRHLGVGIFGAKYIMPVLSRDKEGERLLGEMLHKTDYPSFGQQIIEYDATALCEQWYGLQGMMTCNHPMFAGLFSGYYTTYAGIHSFSDNFRKCVIEPKLPDTADRMECKLNTPRGDMSVSVRRVAGKLYYDIVVPVGMTVKLNLPDGSNKELPAGKHII